MRIQQPHLTSSYTLSRLPVLGADGKQIGVTSMTKTSGNRNKPQPTTLDQVLKVANSSAGRQIERELVRGLMGSLLGPGGKRSQEIKSTNKFNHLKPRRID